MSSVGLVVALMLAALAFPLSQACHSPFLVLIIKSMLPLGSLAKDTVTQVDNVFFVRSHHTPTALGEL